MHRESQAIWKVRDCQAVKSNVVQGTITHSEKAKILGAAQTQKEYPETKPKKIKWYTGWRELKALLIGAAVSLMKSSTGLK